MEFLDNRHTVRYFRIIDQFRHLNKKQVTEKYGFNEEHHILPKSLGGLRRRCNSVYLPARHHFVCHQLLVKMVTGQAKYKMLEALSVFSNNGKRKLELNSRQIALIREANAIASSKRNIGNQHYKKRANYSIDDCKERSDRASISRWVNNGKEERFTRDHLNLVESHEYQYGRMPLSDELIARLTKQLAVAGQPSPEARARGAAKRRGRVRTKEHCANLSKARKREPKIHCDHCDKEVDRLNFQKWHGDKCKHKNSTTLHSKV